MSAITWGLIHERSNIFNGWSVVGVGFFELGGLVMDLKDIILEIPEPSNEEVFTKWFVSEFGSPKVIFISKFGNAEYLRIRAAWNVQQEKILSLKAQLNNMESCYIEKKKQLNDVRAYIESTCSDELVSEIDRIVGVNTHHPEAITQRIYVSFDIKNIVHKEGNNHTEIVGKFEGYGAVDHREDGYVFGCLEDGRPFSCPEQYVREVGHESTSSN